MSPLTQKAPMPVDLLAPASAGLYPIAGLRIGVAEAAIRKADRKDLTLFLLDEGTSVAGVFTRNRFCAAPVQISRAHLASGQPIRALLINTGNANAGTGADGLARAKASCSALVDMLALGPEQILPISTGASIGPPPQETLPFSPGVIMEPLPLERIVAGLPAALANAKSAPGNPQPGHWVRGP